jgi:hypothetical protein
VDSGAELYAQANGWDLSELQLVRFSEFVKLSTLPPINEDEWQQEKQEVSLVA